MFKPFERMQQRTTTAKDDSDTAYYLSLMLYGEFVQKVLVAAIAALVDDDKERHRYRCLWQLVRADSIGKWSEVADQMLQGAKSHHLCARGRELQNEMNSKCSAGSWEHRAIELIHKCVCMLNPEAEALPKTPALRRWLSLMVDLRNKSLRGHGAELSEIATRVSAPLAESVSLIADNSFVFDLEWAYLHQNLSGKYRVVPLTRTASDFDVLRRDCDSHAMEPGVYVSADGFRRVELLFTTVDIVDFFVPNGDFKDKNAKYETISYITNTKEFRDGSMYQETPTALSPSTTSSHGELEVRGNVFTNAPPTLDGYIQRAQKEQELLDAVLAMEFDPIVTLHGRGGIGKTSLSLRILEQIYESDRFDAVLWFSFRDIDLLADGPKQVQPDVLTLEDIATTYTRIVGDSSGRKPQEVFAKGLESDDIGRTLFVFDNFETVRSPQEVFSFIRQCIRLPNKALITSRHREFKGDYPIEVKGMERDECIQLIDDYARHLCIADLITDEYREQLINESDGHPYVIKVFMGQARRAGRTIKPERVIASREDILDALFDRTFVRLTRLAKQVFLMLASWRSTVPRVALEAVMLRNASERVSVEDAVDELEQLSFIEIDKSDADDQLFLTVPLAASQFGRKQLAVSPLRAAVEADVKLLQAFGAARPNDTRHGVEPRVRRLFQHVARMVADGKEHIEVVEPMLNFLAQQYAPSYLLLADLKSESGDREGEKTALRKYLREIRGEASLETWKRLALVCQADEDVLGEIHAWAERCAIPECQIGEISSSANRINYLFSQHKEEVPRDERQILVRRFIDVMEQHINEAVADDLSRLGWLYLQIGDDKSACERAKLGLEREPDNEHCGKLMRKLLESTR